MKLTFILLTAAFLQVSANGFSQNVSLTLKDAPIEQVFREIEKQTGVGFLYTKKMLRDIPKITVNLQDVPVTDALSHCFKGLQLDYSIRNNTIIIKRKSEALIAAPSPPADIVIKGRVTDDKGRALSGASVNLKGSSRGTTTGNDGEFELHLPENKGTLVISFVGYLNDEVQLPKTEPLVIALKLQEGTTEEVILVGYSNKKRSEITSAVTVVPEQKLKDVTTNDLGAMLQGKVAGLQVVRSSGAPGATSEMRLRGISSVNASQSPLIVVDGIIGGNYDPNDVENVTVLKDAGATAMYGSQANAGVIIITTKKAKAGKFNFNVKATTGVRTPDYGRMEMMNGSEVYEYQKQFYRDYNPSASDNSYKIDLLKFTEERPKELKDQDHSWLDEIFSPALVQNYFLSMSGKSDKTDYYVGMSYFNEKGTFLKTNFQRLNLRANTTYHFTDKISMTNNINLSTSNGRSYDYMDIYYAYLNMPWDNPRDSAGNPLYVDGNSPFKWWSRDKINPLHTINNSDHPYRNFDVNYDFNLNIQITKWLAFVSTNRLSAGFGGSTNYFSPTVAGTYHGDGFLEETKSNYYGGISTNLLRFSFIKGDHNISGLAGVAVEGGKSDYMSASGRGLPLGLDVLNVVSNNIIARGANNQTSIQSFISQVNYSYLNRYFLSGSYRIDGSSAFPEDNRYASFPSISAAWMVSNENFYQDRRVVDNLKLRLSYGVTGTQDIGASRYLGLYSLTTQYNSTVAATPLQLPSPNLTWESKYQLNAGVDLSLFKRVNLTVDVYNNNTRDLLLQAPQPLSVGFEQRWENTGRIINKGIEIGLNTINIKTKDWEWTTDFNINFNSNKLEDFPNEIVKTTGAWPISQIYREGGNLYEFYMPKWLGVDPQTGAPLWEKVVKDGQGNNVGKEATSDYAAATFQEVGSALPQYQGSIGTSLRYRNLTFTINGYYMYGNKVFSNNLRFVMNDGSEPYMNQIVLPSGYNIWTKPGDIASNPSPQNSANSTQTSTRYLKDGSYFAIRYIALSYDLPQHFIKRAKLQGATVSVTADNVYTFTKFLGQDPQTTITPGEYVTPGVSDFKYPNNRQFLLNINFRF
ncbi:SusC/RagA family TonB-linked outer membrane protein [Flavihumibacter petaseus]|nr:SusC/RagA family TonB-linked outer membrane protein [Flavihumibacter petaseus]